LYYQNCHITLTKSRNKTASATAAAVSHHELCKMSMATAIKPVKKTKNPHFLCAPWLPTPLATFFLIREIKKLEIRKSSDFGVLQSPKKRIARILFINKIIRHISILSF
jgi:hypothetical protein